MTATRGDKPAAAVLHCAFDLTPGPCDLSARQGRGDGMAVIATVPGRADGTAFIGNMAAALQTGA